MSDQRPSNELVLPYADVLKAAIKYERLPLALTAMCSLCGKETQSSNLHRMIPEPGHTKDCPLKKARAADEPRACCFDAPVGMHHPTCLNIGSPVTRAVQPPSAAPMKMHVDREWMEQRLGRTEEEHCAAGGPAEPPSDRQLLERLEGALDSPDFSPRLAREQIRKHFAGLAKEREEADAQRIADRRADGSNERACDKIIAHLDRASVTKGTEHE